MEEEKKVEETKEVKPTYKKHGPLYWLIIIVGMTFIVFMSVRMGEKIAKEKIDKEDGGKPSTVTSNSNSNKPEENKEVKEEEKTKINEKMSLLFSNAKIENNNIKVYSLSDIWSPIFKGNVSETDIIKSLIFGARESDVVAYKYTNGTFTDKYKSMDKGGAIYASKINEYYKKLTNKEITNYVDESLGCPMYAYDSTNKMYVEVVGCGGVGYDGQLVYLDSYTKNEDTIVVGTYVAGIHGEYVDSAVNYILVDYYDYATYASAKLYKKGGEELSNFKIDESNKTSFTKYNFTFKKAADGEYYFESAAKAN